MDMAGMLTTSSITDHIVHLDGQVSVGGPDLGLEQPGNLQLASALARVGTPVAFTMPTQPDLRPCKLAWPLKLLRLGVAYTTPMPRAQLRASFFCIGIWSFQSTTAGYIAK